MERKKEDFNFDSAIASVDRIKEMKSKNTIKQSTSIKPLQFEISKEDSELKKLLIQQINSKNLTYSDLHNYCTQIMGGNISGGKNLGYNLITGLRKRPTMTDVTFLMLCDFLNLDVVLKERESIDEEDIDGEEE